MIQQQVRPPRVPPRWFVRSAWATHRALVDVSGGRFGLRLPRNGHPGLLRLTTVGRRTGTRRSVILSYVEDGTDMVILAMNGWADAPPAWWLNLQAQPLATVDLGPASLPVRAHEARGEERARLWALLDEWTPGDLDSYAALRSAETPVVVLEPATDDAA